MRATKMVVAFVGLMGVLLGPTCETWAKGAPEPFPPFCLLFNFDTLTPIKPGPQTKKFTATVAIDVTDGAQSTDFTTDVTADYVIRAERLNQIHFFRINLVTSILNFTINEKIICLVLNPDETGNFGAVHDSVLALHQAMLDALSLTDTPYFCITDSSIQQTDGVFDTTVPNTLHAMGLADVLVYARTKPCDQP